MSVQSRNLLRVLISGLLVAMAAVIALGFVVISERGTVNASKQNLAVVQDVVCQQQHVIPKGSAVIDTATAKRLVRLCGPQKITTTKIASVVLNGPTGPRGPRGRSGARGETGAAGRTGRTGARGARGQTGRAGARGARGEAGARGQTGREGPTGPIVSTAEIQQAAQGTLCKLDPALCR